MSDFTQELSEKERQITETEKQLETVLQAQGAIEIEITDYRIRMTEISLAMKQKQQVAEGLDTAIRQAKFTISRLKREHASLMREYFKVRDMAKGMR